MSADLALVLAWIVALAAWLFVHVRLALRLHAARSRLGARAYLAWVPPLGVWLAWRGGERPWAVLWLVAAALYLALRIAGGAWLGGRA